MNIQNTVLGTLGFVKRRLYTAAICLWALGVAVGSVLPVPVKDMIGTHQSVLAHRLFHILSFGSTALLGMVLLKKRSHQLGLAVAVMALGVAVELTQYYFMRSLDLE